MVTLKVSDIAKTVEAMEIESRHLPGAVKKAKVIELLKAAWPTIDEVVVGDIIDLICDVAKGVYELKKRKAFCFRL